MAAGRPNVGWGLTYQVDSDPSVTTSGGSAGPIPVSAEGTTIIRFFAEDNAENAEGEKLRVVKIDKSSPTIQTFGPTGTDVLRHENVLVEFDDEMDADTFTSATVKLVNKTTGRRVKDVDLVYDETDKKLIVDPYPTSTKLLGKNDKYKVTLTTGVKNAAGFTLPIAFTWTFKTGVA